MWLIGLLLSINVSSAETLRVAVVDTGLNLLDKRVEGKLCPEGHKDLTGKGINDVEGHGTHVVGDIVLTANKTNYCLIILKYYHSGYSSNLIYSLMLKEIQKLQPNIVNVSLSGTEFIEEEYLLIKNNPQIKFIVAAGNDGVDITEEKRYPASYHLPNMIVVGNGWSKYNKSATSNFGSLVDVWIDGESIVSWATQKGWVVRSGSSMSTALYTGRYLNERY